MHQSPQKQIETRRDRNAVYAAFELDDDIVRRPPRGGQPRMRKSEGRDEAPNAPRSSRQHPRG
ncbi:hypothetical protein ACPWT1_11190 [Ramlibacter sp. MMS24-I3-19]|uniref:hypothetical protein n=1 Tax=Ramlibacter sp. MMS24-I3-19 TaxID=3416606 RepID=UPI003D0956B4